MTQTRLRPGHRALQRGAPGSRTSGERRTALERRAATRGWLFTAPALAVVGAVMIFPVIFAVYMSVSNVTVTGNGIQLSGITGSNYSVLVHAPRYWHDLEFTALYTVCTVTVETVLGTLIALVLERLEVGRGWLMALMLLPWALITVVSAELWSYISNGVYGVLDAITQAFGMHGVNVLGTPLSAAVAMSVADIWKTPRSSRSWSWPGWSCSQGTSSRPGWTARADGPSSGESGCRC